MKNSIILIPVAFMISACSTKTEYVKTYIYVKPEIAIVSVKEDPKLEKVSPEVSQGKITFSEIEFKKMTSNILLLRHQRDYLKTVIKYYEDSLKKEPSN